MKYQFSICRTMSTLVILLILAGAILLGGSYRMFVHVPTFAITFGLCFFMLLCVYETEFLKFIAAAFRILFCKTLEPHPRFAQIALFGSRAIIGVGLIGMLIGLIQMLSNLSDPQGIGIGMATAFVCPLYSIIISEVFFAIAYQSFKDSQDKQEKNAVLPIVNAGLPLVIILFIISTFGILLSSFSHWNIN